MDKIIKTGIGALLGMLWVAFGVSSALAETEISAGFNYNHSTYSATDYSWTRRWAASVGYHFTETSELEMGVQDVTDRTSLTNYENTTFHDRIFSVDWVQSLTGRDFPVQPYVKGGIGQLNRDATGNYSDGSSPPKVYDTMTAILGVGIRIYLTRTFAIRTEATSYLEGARLATWQDNIGVTAGLSYTF